MKRLFNMPPQIIRLVLLTIAIICTYFSARYLLTPQSFGQYGHYRGLALQEIAAREPFWAGRKTCDACHGEIVGKLAKAEHKGLSCETCHGPSRAHVENPEVKLPKLSYSQCVRCHEASTSRPTWLHRVPCSPPTQRGPMSENLTRRNVLKNLAGIVGGLLALPAGRTCKAAVQNVFATSQAPGGYDPTQHKWLMALDVDRCIGCGMCVEACKAENSVPDNNFRTWIERYVITRPKPGSGDSRGEAVVDSPNGGIGGFKPSLIPKTDILKSFFVPKLCNQCENSPCSQVCPVGATFESPDGVVLVDKNYCIGCGFCIQACPYGCRFLSPATNTAEKCTMCYHRITRGLRPACVEICPSQARIFGDLKNPVADDPLQRFMENNKTQGLKAHLGTKPRVRYAGMDEEVR